MSEQNTGQWQPAHYPKGVSPFFKASCGCIGLHIGQNQCCIVSDCTRDYPDNELEISRPCRFFDPNKIYTPLSQDETEKLLQRLNILISRGFELERMAWLMSGITERGDKKTFCGQP